MIKVAFITPVKFLEYMTKGDFLFALAQHVDNEDYVNFFANRPVNFECMIDNGTAEGKRVSIDALIQAAKKVNANSIWVHDELYRTDETLRLHKEFIAALSDEEKKRFRLFGIPQGNNIHDWVRCYEKILEMPEITGICLSKYSVPSSFVNSISPQNIMAGRVKCLEYLQENNMVKPNIYYHCAGASHFILRELKAYRRFSFVRSIDSNIAFKMGLHKIFLQDAETEPNERLDFELEKIDEIQRDIIKFNIQAVNEEAKSDGKLTAILIDERKKNGQQSKNEA